MWSAHSYNPRTLQEVFWPINFYFDAYPDVSTLKTIMKHSRNRALVCSSAYATPTTPVPRRILDSCYTQMLDALLQAVVTSTKDMTEIVRLARLLWGNVMEVICDQSAQWTQREGPAGNDLEALQVSPVPSRCGLVISSLVSKPSLMSKPFFACSSDRPRHAHSWLDPPNPLHVPLPSHGDALRVQLDPAYPGRRPPPNLQIHSHRRLPLPEYPSHRR
mmetsp:Transcript_42667/g.100084  ORF Transcript_42667/g.100084 Transcript_42667/m.100084 type:complete len:218 (-) Transcript_42667:425-1078(-)